MEEKKDIETNKKEKKKSDVKKTLRNLVALVLVAVISVMATLAYLKTLSNEEINTFSGSKGIKTTLDEPNYNENQADKYEPGMTVPKNPILTNTSTGDTTAKEWVAILVKYQYAQSGEINPATYAFYNDIMKVIEPIGFNTSERLTEVVAAARSKSSKTQEDLDIISSSGAAITEKKYWKVIDVASLTNSDINGIESKDSSKYLIYMYCRTLENGAKTDIALFDQIKIKSETVLNPNTTELNLDANDFYDDVNKEWSLPKFNIIVLGAAIKNEYTTESDSAAEATTWDDLSNDDQKELEKNLVEVFFNNGSLPDIVTP